MAPIACFWPARVSQREGWVIRAEQNWIGGNRVNPVGAAYASSSRCRASSAKISSPSLNRSEPIAIAAIAHAQLETNHPFADGNGRAGRALVHLILKKGGTIGSNTVLPISLLLATDRERYIANLAWASKAMINRAARDDERWVDTSPVSTCEASRARLGVRARAACCYEWMARRRCRPGGVGGAAYEILLGTPVISIKTAQNLTGKSYPAALTVGEIRGGGF